VSCVGEDRDAYRRGRGRGECHVLFVIKLKSLVDACNLVVRDGEAAEDGKAAGGVQRRGLRTTQAATRAALVAFLV